MTVPAFFGITAETAMGHQPMVLRSAALVAVEADREGTVRLIRTLHGVTTQIVDVAPAGVTAANLLSAMEHHHGPVVVRAGIELGVSWSFPCEAIMGILSLAGSGVVVHLAGGGAGIELRGTREELLAACVAASEAYVRRAQLQAPAGPPVRR